MDLLLFAHRNEALPFIEGLQADETLFSGVYRGPDYWALITGEGIEVALSKTSALLAHLKSKNKSPQKAINLGVAGALSPHLELGKVYNVRTFYGEKSSYHPEFKSFSSSEQNTAWDCISSAQRVLEDEYALKLKPIADIVDREAWGFAYACALMKVPFQAHKYISDRAGHNTQCFEIKADSLLYAQNLYDYYISLQVPSTLNPHSEFEVLGDLKTEFYFTSSSANKFKKYLDALAKKGLSSEKIHNKLNLKNIISQESHPKKRVQILLSELRGLANPLEEKILHRLQEATKDLNFGKTKVQFDGELEKADILLNAKISSSADVDELVAKLLQFKYDEISDVFTGELDQ